MSHYKDERYQMMKIDINKIVQGDRPKNDRNSATITAKQCKEKEKAKEYRCKKI